MIDKKPKCNNCDKYGHQHKNCRFPITSIGILAIKLNLQQKYINELITYFKSKQDLYDGNLNINVNNLIDPELFSLFKDNIKMMLIRRRFTLGFMEFIRGRYRSDNKISIVSLFKQMIQEEIDLINNNNFETLWKLLWYPTEPDIVIEKNWEYYCSEDKFNILKDINNELNLNTITNDIKLQWAEPEWGFPKGKRNNNEDDIKCATREFFEETNITTDKYILFNNLPKLEENLIGTNGKKYKHVYYLAMLTSDIDIDIISKSQKNEIGDIGLFNYDEAIKLIRPYHLDRRLITTNVLTAIINALLRIYHKEDILDDKSIITPILKDSNDIDE